MQDSTGDPPDPSVDPFDDSAGEETSSPQALKLAPAAFEQVAQELLREGQVLVYDGQMPAFEKLLAKLNKKAAQFDLPAIEVLASTPKLFQHVTETDDRGRSFYSCHLLQSPDQARGEQPYLFVRAQAITLRFPQVKLGNWRVLGMMEPLAQGTLLYAFSREEADAQDLEPYRMRPIGCDHCRTRRKRSLGFVLKDDASHEIRQVGHSCLRDYTGIDPEAALFLAKLWGKLPTGEEDLAQGFSGAGWCITPLDFLRNVVFLAQRTGFVSVSRARDSIPAVEPTYVQAASLRSHLEHDGALRAAWREEKPVCETKAQAILDWVQALPENTSDAFARNVQIACAQEFLRLREPRHLAIVAAAYSLYERAHSDPGDKTPRVPSTHFGAPGEKHQKVLTLVRRSVVETMYGLHFILVMRDDEHRIFVWKTGRPPQELSAVDSLSKTFMAQFRIKGHSAWKDVLQTDVTHLKFLGWVEETPAASVPEVQSLAA